MEEISRVNSEDTSNLPYLRLCDYDILSPSIIFVSQVPSAEFDSMKEHLRAASLIGFDTEFRCTSSKYEQQGIATMQLATLTTCYIIDYLVLENYPALQ